MLHRGEVAALGVITGSGSSGLVKTSEAIPGGTVIELEKPIRAV